MVVHAGDSCKIIMHQKRFRKKFALPYFITLCEKIAGISIAIILSLSLIFTLVHIRGLYVSFANTFLHYFLLFSPTVPYYLYPTLDIVSFVLWWKYK